jgi:hypothetical protein
MQWTTPETFEKRVKERYGEEYTILGRYITTHTPITLKHNKCGNIWDTTAPYDFLKPNANGCPKCSHPARRKTHSDFIKEVEDLVGEEYTVLGTYITRKDKLPMKHETCGNIWEVRPNMFLSNGTRCPECAKLKADSKGVIKIKNFLMKKKIKFTEEQMFEDLELEAPLRIDFYLWDHQLAIEFDGEQHFKPKRGGIEEFESTKRRDEKKNEFCKEYNLPLLRIPFYRVKEIDTILTSFLIENGVLKE